MSTAAIFNALIPVVALSAHTGTSQQVIRFDLPEIEARSEVSSEPLYSLGDDPDDEIFRVWGMLVDSGGDLVIGNGGFQRVDHFSDDGTLVRSDGRAGQGPGEFQSIQGIALRGDSVYAFDFLQSRVNVFGPNGEAVRTIRIPRSADLDVPNSLIGIAGERLLLATTRGVTGSEAESGVIVRPPVHVLVLTLGGELERVIEGFSGREILMITRRSGDRVGSTKATIPFGRDLFLSVSGSNLVVGDNRDFSIRYFDPATGREVRRSELNAAGAEPLSRADRRRVEGTLRALTDNDRSVDMGGLEIPSTKPAFAQMLGDTRGCVWVRLPEEDESSTQWVVLDRAGQLAGRTSLPEGSRVESIGNGRVVVATYDEYGTVIRVYRADTNRFDC